jgi:hypothetical protein
MIIGRTKAFKNLRIWTKMNVYPLLVVDILEYDPLFDSISNDTEFQQIQRDSEKIWRVDTGISVFISSISEYQKTNKGIMETRPNKSGI